MNNTRRNIIGLFDSSIREENVNGLFFHISIRRNALFFSYSISSNRYWRNVFIGENPIEWAKKMWCTWFVRKWMKCYMHTAGLEIVLVLNVIQEMVSDERTRLFFFKSIHRRIFFHNEWWVILVLVIVCLCLSHISFFHARQQYDRISSENNWILIFWSDYIQFIIGMLKMMNHRINRRI